MPGRFSLDTAQEHMMRVQWALANSYQPDPKIDLDSIKAIGPMWGSWKTWRSCNTDNVVCHPAAKARELLDRAFQAVCNFYVPRSQYEFLKRPVGVRLYEGEYAHEVDDVEDIVCLHLAGSQSDIVLLLGFNLEPITASEDRLATHKLVNRHGLIRGAFVSMPTVQWVVVDPPGKLDKAYQDLPNLTCDTMNNVLKLLV